MHMHALAILGERERERERESCCGKERGSVAEKECEMKHMLLVQRRTPR
jgi:hypothetical protein